MTQHTTVSFPGIGIGNFSLDNEAFNIGGDFPVFWYGIIITLGIVFAFLYTSFRGKYEGVKFDDIIDIALWTVILGVLGARLYYVLTTLEYYIPEPFHLGEFLKNVFDLREGGLAIYGGIIAGALGILISTKIKKLNTIKLMDMAAPGVMIAQSLGRWGNFFNGEAHGGIVSESSPLYFIRMGLLPNEDSSSTMYYYHPTFLYESLWNLAGFILINFFYKKKKFNGQIACMYLAWYGFGRFFIEGLRTDSLYIPGTEIRISQLIGILCFVIFGGLLIAGFIYSKKFNDTDAKLTKLDKLLKPSINMNPVFFEKKVKAVEGVEINGEPCDENTDSSKEDGKNGTDN